MNLYNQLCEPRFLYDAWLRVARKKGTSGVDSQDIEAFASSAEKNILKISKALCDESYEPSPLRSVQIPKERPGAFRRLGIPTIQDRVVFQGVNFLLQKTWTPRFSPLSFAYRFRVGVADAIEAAIGLVKAGKRWFTKGDIRGCFDELNWDVLSLALKEWLSDEPLRRLIQKALRVPTVQGGRIIPRHKGVPQGSPLSPILSNLYLHPFDYEMLSHGFPPIRYGDDWIILSDNESAAAEAFQIAAASLSRLYISINSEKSGIGNLEEESVVFLGHKIDATGIDASAKGWKRFAQALGKLENARTPEEATQARALLSNLKSFYRNAGKIG